MGGLPNEIILTERNHLTQFANISFSLAARYQIFSLQLSFINILLSFTASNQFFFNLTSLRGPKVAKGLYEVLSLNNGIPRIIHRFIKISGLISMSFNNVHLSPPF